MKITARAKLRYYKQYFPAIAFAFFSGGMPLSAEAQPAWDHAAVVGPNECLECHELTGEIWKETTHYATFNEMPRKKEARDIAKAMGLKRIKAGSLCLDCHFTSTLEDGKREPVSGISCESCHSPAKKWLKIHSEFSGKKKETETPEEAKQRWADSEAAGMIRPKNMYAWAKNCYSCHVVPQEELVNKGGHPAGSNFELVAWSQGEIRHNVWYTEGKENKKASMERKRLMFVVGKGLELEIALRAVAKATQKDKYAVAMAQRADRARKHVKALAEALSVPDLDEMAKAGFSAGLKLNNEAELTAAADRVSESLKKLAAAHDGSQFGAIDKVLPSEEQYKGRPSR